MRARPSLLHALFSLHGRTPGAMPTPPAAAAAAASVAELSEARTLLTIMFCTNYHCTDLKVVRNCHFVLSLSCIAGKHRHHSCGCSRRVRGAHGGSLLSLMMHTYRIVHSMTVYLNDKHFSPWLLIVVVVIASDQSSSYRRGDPCRRRRCSNWD